MKKLPRRPWTPSEYDRAKRLKTDGYSYAEIDRLLNRRPGSTCLKLGYVAIKHDPAGRAIGSMRVPDHVLTERDVRREATYRRDLTAEFFGDPAPGYSMRDRRA